MGESFVVQHDDAQADDPTSTPVGRPDSRWSLLQSVARWLPLEIAIVGLVVWSASRVLHLANADALLPSLMSTQQLTWFYWGQDRLGNLVPAITWPIRDVRWNLAAQLGLIGTGWFVLCALFSANHLLGTRRHPTPWTLAGSTVVAGVLSLTLMPAATEQILVFEQLYAFALGIFLAGLWAIQRDDWRWRAAGIAAVFAAMMVNPSLVLFTPFALLLPSTTFAVKRLVLPFFGAVLSFGVVTILSSWLGTQSQPDAGYNNFSFNEMRHNFGDALDGVIGSVHGRVTLLVLVIAVVVVAFRSRSAHPRLWVTYLVAPAFGVVWTFVFGGNKWVDANFLSSRYFFPLYAAALLIITAGITEAMATVSERVELPIMSNAARRFSSSVAIVLMVVTPVVAIWLIERIEIDALAQASPAAATVRQFDVDLVTGGYWATWPLVVEARSQGSNVLGVSFRSVAIDDMVEQRIRREIIADTLTVLCIDLQPQQCVDSVAEWSQRELALNATLSASPLVVELIAEG